jgi:hypothetical protein
MNKIEIPSELSERSKMGIKEAKSEMNKNKKMKYFFIFANISSTFSLPYILSIFVLRELSKIKNSHN